MAFRQICLAMALSALVGGCAQPPVPEVAPTHRVPPPVLPPAATPQIFTATPTVTPTPEPEEHLLATYKVAVDEKPALSSLKNLPDRTGLTLAPEGLYYALPNSVHAWKWGVITRVYLDEIVGVPTIVICSGPEDQNDATLISLKSANPANAEWAAELAAGKELIPLIAKASGLSLTSPDRYERTAKIQPVPPNAPKYVAFTHPGPKSITMKNAQLAELPGPIGVFVNPGGVAWAGPDRIESIAWPSFKSYELRDDPPLVTLASHSGQAPADFVAIALEGPVGDNPDCYLKAPDFIALAGLLKSKQPPPKAYAFNLFSSRKDRGPADDSPPPKSPLLPISVAATDKIWPGSSLASYLPLRSGLYFLPTGLIQVLPNSIFQIAWADVHNFGSTPSGSFGIELGTARLDVQPSGVSDTPDLQALGKEILDITGLQTVDHQRGIYNNQNHPTPKPPTSARFYPDNGAHGEWRGPALAKWGDQVLADGIHLIPEGFLLVNGAEVDAFRWEDLIEAKLEGEEFSVRLSDIYHLRMPIRSVHGPHPLAMYKDALKALPAYFIKGTEKERPEGKARPFGERPKEARHFLVKDYPPDPER